MEAQGYKLKDSVIYQDNKSAILMEVNGRNSCTGNSRHIDIRYFWIKDRVDNKEVRIEYLPTHILLADYYTKPLQGSRFRVLREYIMGWRPIEDLTITKFDENESENLGGCWYKANLYLCNSNCRPIKYDKDHGNNTCSS